MISSLFFFRHPSTIPGLVVTVIVNAIYLKAERAFAHVQQKCSKISAPFFSYAHSPAAVVSVRGVSRSVASIDHTSPDFIGRRFFTPVTMTMFCVARNSLFRVPAAAAFADASNEIVTDYRSFGTAFTATSPNCLPVGMGKADNGPSKKCHSSKVVSFHTAAYSREHS